MKSPLFITGIGTGIGKTLAAAIVTEALQADYWKPIQAGIEGTTDSLLAGSLISNTVTVIHEELYRLQLPASPHIAAEQEGITIDTGAIASMAARLHTGRPLVIEGAGGLMVPLNERQFIADLIKQLDATVMLVSRNYLGSINHSLLTAAVCRQYGLKVCGWIFNDEYMQYESSIAGWSGYPVIGSIPKMAAVNRYTVREQAIALRPQLMKLLE